MAERVDKELPRKEKLRVVRPDLGGPFPEHIAIIMDGNGRWAEERGMRRVFGHREGIGSVREITTECARMGVGSLTLYAFSVENWKRPRAEVRYLMRLLRHFLVEERTVNAAEAYFLGQGRSGGRVKRGRERCPRQQRRHAMTDRLRHDRGRIAATGRSAIQDRAQREDHRLRRYFGVHTNHAWLLSSGPRKRSGVNSRRAIVNVAAISRSRSRKSNPL